MPIVIIFGIAGLVLGIRRLRAKVRESMDDHPKEYPFCRPTEENEYRVFPDEMENDQHIFFHGTAKANLQSILRDGFKIPVTDPKSVSFARDSSLTLVYASTPRSEPPREGCIIAVRFDDPQSPRIVPEHFGIHVSRQDALPHIMGWCIVPETYKHI
jgi:hypothetical protein